ncbi:hypothetical protein, partial [Novipirellula sp.]|uniref:hypothetical protein n=1 Tax=Novipirellula sp. TaxID=2795430 RepID=UPI003569C766
MVSNRSQHLHPAGSLTRIRIRVYMDQGKSSSAANFEETKTGFGARVAFRCDPYKCLIKAGERVWCPCFSPPSPSINSGKTNMRQLLTAAACLGALAAGAVVGAQDIA